MIDIRIEYDDNGVLIYKAGGDDSKRYIGKISGCDPIDDLIDQAFDNEN